VEQHQKYMKEAIKQANEAYKKGFVPVGCVIVQNSTKEQKIIAKAHNNDFTHAEILCIQNAQKKAGKYLNNCVLFCTLKPCKMCEEMAKSVHIETIVYGADCVKEEKRKVEFIGSLLQIHIRKFITTDITH